MSAYNESDVLERNSEASFLTESMIGVRLRSFFLLVVLFLPVILTVIEILGKILSGPNTQKVVPTPTLFGLGYF